MTGKCSDLQGFGPAFAAEGSASGPLPATAIGPPGGDPFALTESHSAPEESPLTPKASNVAPTKAGSPRKYILAAAAVIALVAGAHYGYDYISAGWYLVTTDDAYVKADITNVATKVSGFIKSFPVAENTAITPGTVIAEIDDGDYLIALNAAKTKAETQRATIARFDSQALQADAAIAQARAQLAGAEADAKRTETDFVRYAQLTRDKVATPQKLEQALADRDHAKATVASSIAALANAEAAKAVLAAQRGEAEHLLGELLVQVDKAERDLSFTKVRSSVGGVFGNRGAQVGTYVQPGTRLGALIADESLFIEANFKETQLRGLQPGQAATIEVDALGGTVLHGTVVSFAPGSGSVFSLLPPENATGNFTKIVQRIPVRIALPADQRTVNVLRPGMSVTVSVDTKAAPTGGGAVAVK